MTIRGRLDGMRRRCSRAKSSTAENYVQSLQQFIERMNRPPVISFRHTFAGEFDALMEEDRMMCRQYPSQFESSCRPENMWRNRYPNILANEYTRVKLKVEAGQSDYINANYIPSEPPWGGYIATQAPISDTVGHFWQMVYEQRVPVILMLTRERDGKWGMSLSERYWPMEGKKERWGLLEVSGEGERLRGDPIIRERKFKVSKIGEEMEADHGVLHVTQLQYLEWPDKGIPSGTESILKLRKLVKGLSRPAPGESERPVVVHCSAGVGRTGTFLAADIALTRVENALRDRAGLDHPALQLDSMREIVRDLKFRRSKLVQTSEQYRFIFDVVLDGVKEFAARSSRGN